MRIVLLCLMLTGCAITWQHPTKSEEDFNHENLDCETRAAPIQDNTRHLFFVVNCMETKGWRRVGPLSPK